jgi:hypothetical protein
MADFTGDPMSNQQLIKDLQALTDFDKIINFAKYPIKDLDSPAARTLLQTCRQQIKATGACEMEEFVTPQALDLMQQESHILEKHAFFKPVVGNAYLAPGDPSLPKDHPLNMTETTRVGVIAYDQYPEISLLRRIYEYDPLMKFIGAIMELPEIHRYGDPMGGLNLSVMVDQDYLRWHFDQTDFVTSLSIQNADQGGEFEYVPLIRSASEEHYAEVKKLIEGDHSRVIRITNKPGTLVLFKGRYSIHRVTPIQGQTSRLMGLFGFDSKPNVCSTPHLLEMRYGRQKPLANKPTF